MTLPLSREVLSDLFVAACQAELHALKPGNVHIHAAGHGMNMAHFEAAARAAAPFIADPGLGVGERVERAVGASVAAAGCNTNLGIVLLCVPLAAAAQAGINPPTSLLVASPSPQPSPLGERVGVRGQTYTNCHHETQRTLRERLGTVLANLDREDAACAFRAILRADPAGLGAVEKADVRGPASVTLLEAMALAQDRDRIARAYVTAFEDIFALGLPALRDARGRGVSEDDAITTLHMAYLAAFPDSHIARKHGMVTAEAVCADARVRRSLWSPAVRPETRPELLVFDGELKARGLNPGTTADLVVATLYADSIIGRTVAREPA